MDQLLRERPEVRLKDTTLQRKATLRDDAKRHDAHVVTGGHFDRVVANR